MLIFKKIKKTLALVMALAFCLCALPTVTTAEEPTYALNGTINSVLEIMNGTPTVNLTDDDTSGQITIALQGDKTKGAIFTAYKLLNIVRNTTTKMLEVSIPNNDDGKAQAFWNKYTGKTNATINDIKTKINDFGENDSQKSSSIVEEFVKLSDAELPNSTASSLTENNEAFITTTFGFYAILQTGAPVNGYIASAPVLACLPMQETDSNGVKTGNWLKSYTVKPKDDTISITKQVKATGDGATYKDETITNIGDTVSYEIIAELPTYGADIVNSTNGIIYTIEDQLPAGVTYTDGSASAALIKQTESGDVEDISSIVPSYSGGKITLTIPASEYKTSINGTYYKIKITYSALLNGSAVVEGDGNTNTATLKYSSYADQTTTTKADAKVYTMGLDITKIEKGSPATTLAGAEFEVHLDPAGTDAAIEFIDKKKKKGSEINYYRVATPGETGSVTKIVVTDSADADKNGKLMIDGLNNTTYYLKETKAPTGYNLPTDLFDIEVAPTANSGETKYDYSSDNTNVLDFDGNRLSKDIENSTGIDLPVTGGMGTVIFTAIGLLLMAGAAYFLFRGKKSSN